MNIWGTFDDHRILRTLITFWGLWGRLEYLLWTSEDFEGFDDLLRNLRTFWGSVENLRSEYLGYLLFIFLTFYGLCGPFEDFLKTRGPDALRTLKNISGTFDDFLCTFWGPEAFEEFKDFSGHWGSLRTWLPTEELRTLINFWGHWGRFDVLLEDLWGFEDIEDLFSNLRIIWGPWPENVGDLLSFSWPFEDFVYLLRTFWRPEDLRISKHWRIFWTFWWPLVDIWGLFLGTFEDFVRTIWWTFEDPLTTTGFWGRW